MYPKTLCKAKYPGPSSSTQTALRAPIAEDVGYGESSFYAVFRQILCLVLFCCCCCRFRFRNIPSRWLMSVAMCAYPAPLSAVLTVV